ncbi:hypothetical protein N9M16_01545 [Candidatus Dependentiae bacterium]|nr:hypothetical protein [Candidatus Dependentiae bacterium]
MFFFICRRMKRNSIATRWTGEFISFLVRAISMLTSCFVYNRWPKYAKSARFYDSQSELRDGISVTRRVLRSLIPFVMKSASKYTVAQLDAVGYVKQSHLHTQIPNYHPIDRPNTPNRRAVCERLGVTTAFTTEGGDRTTMNQIIERKRAHERYVHRNLCTVNQTDAEVVFYLFTVSSFQGSPTTRPTRRRGRGRR